MHTNNDYYLAFFEHAAETAMLMEGHHIIDVNQAAVEAYELESKEQFSVIHPSQMSPQYQPDGQTSFEKANKMMDICYEQGHHKFIWLSKSFKGREFLTEVFLKVIYFDNKKMVLVTERNVEKEVTTQRDLATHKRLLEDKNRILNEIKNKINGQEDQQLIENLTLFEEYKRVLDESSIVSKTNALGEITFVNDKFCEISGYSKQELIGADHNIVTHPDMPRAFFAHMWKTIQSKHVFKGIIKNKNKFGKTYYVDTTILPIVDHTGDIVEYISVRHDVTKIYEQDLVIHQQNTDQLTGLPNRNKLSFDIIDAITPALALINIDQFRDINESYGADIGDQVLTEVARRLTLEQEINITPYRITGDTFALLAIGNTPLDQFIEKTKLFINELKSTPFDVGGEHIALSATAGISTNSEKLLPDAEIAHLHAKTKSLTYTVFDENLPIYKERFKNIQTTQAIKEAINNDRVVVFGQKIVSNTSSVVKYETLMRIEKENGELISPFCFLDQAKKAKLYPMLTKAMIKKSCSYFQGNDIEFAINLMYEDIANHDTINYLFETIEATSTGHRLTIEIVETEGIEGFQDVEDFIEKAKTLGCKIAIDDFGTGYSNFEYLTKLDIDILKIDGSLIKNIHLDKNLHLTVKTIVNFAKVLGIEVVAEFVHCQEVQTIVKSLNIEYSQGYLFHEPERLTLE